MAILLVPSHVNETTDPVDNTGGILSIVAIAAIVLAINFAPVPNKGSGGAGSGGARARRAGRLSIAPEAHQVSVVRSASCRTSYLLGRGVGRDRRVRQPDGRDIRGSAVPAERARLLDARRGSLDFASCAADGGDRATLGQAGGHARGQVHLLVGYIFCLLGIHHDAALWKTGIPYWKVALAYCFIGIGVGFAGTPASHSLTGSVPSDAREWHPGTADLQRDLGGAIIQSIMGALLTAGFATAVSKAIASAPNKVADHQQRPEHSHQVILERRIGGQSVSALCECNHGRRKVLVRFRIGLVLRGGIIAITFGAALIFFLFPGKNDEQRLLAEYQAQDTSPQTPRSNPKGGMRWGRARGLGSGW